jgi:hypothetical protein
VRVMGELDDLPGDRARELLAGGVRVVVAARD